MNVQSFLVHFLKDRTGTTAIEYALIASGIALAIFAVIGQLGGSVLGKYQTVSNSLK